MRMPVGEFRRRMGEARLHDVGLDAGTAGGQSSRSFGIAPGVHHSDNTTAARSMLADVSL